MQSQSMMTVDLRGSHESGFLLDHSEPSNVPSESYLTHENAGLFDQGLIESQDFDPEVATITLRNRNQHHDSVLNGEHSDDSRLDLAPDQLNSQLNSSHLNSSHSNSSYSNPSHLNHDQEIRGEPRMMDSQAPSLDNRAPPLDTQDPPLDAEVPDLDSSRQSHLRQMRMTSPELNLDLAPEHRREYISPTHANYSLNHLHMDNYTHTRQQVDQTSNEHDGLSKQALPEDSTGMGTPRQKFQDLRRLDTVELDELERAEATPNTAMSPDLLMTNRGPFRRTSGRRPLSILSSSSMNSDHSHSIDQLTDPHHFADVSIMPHAGISTMNAPSSVTYEQQQPPGRHRRHRSMLGAAVECRSPPLLTHHSNFSTTNLASPGGASSPSMGPGPGPGPLASHYFASPNHVHTPSSHGLQHYTNYGSVNYGSSTTPAYSHYAYTPQTTQGVRHHSDSSVVRQDYVGNGSRSSSVCSTPFLSSDIHQFGSGPSHMQVSGAAYSQPHDVRSRRNTLLNSSNPLADHKNAFHILENPAVNPPIMDPNQAATIFFDSPLSPSVDLGTEQAQALLEAANEGIQDLFVALAYKERQVLEAKQTWEYAREDLDSFRRQLDCILTPREPQIALPARPSIISRRHQPNLGIHSLRYVPFPNVSSIHNERRRASAQRAVSSSQNKAGSKNASNAESSSNLHPPILQPCVVSWNIDDEVPAPTDPANMDVIVGGNSSLELVQNRRGRSGVAYHIVKCLLGIVHCIITTLPVHQRDFYYQQSEVESLLLIPEYPMPMDALFSHLSEDPRDI